MDQKRVPSYVPLFFMTFTLCFGFGYAIAQLNINDIKNNWEERRCEPSVLASSWLYSPSEYEGGSSQFASDNFTFCTNKIIDTSLGYTFSPVQSMFQQTVKSSDQVHSSMNFLRGTASNFQKLFMGMMDPVYQRFSAVTHAVSNIFVRMKFAMSRLNTVLITAVFAGLAGYKAIINAIRLVIMIVQIILGIITGLMIILFLILWPFSALIAIVGTIVAVTMGVISGIIAGEVGNAMSGFKDGSGLSHSKTLCVPGGTLVETASGLCPIEKIAPGGVLKGGGTVEGVLRASGSDAEFVSIDGILVGKGHLVWDTVKKGWCSSEDHGRATSSEVKAAFVYCLNTSDRTWTVRGAGGDASLLLRDWEELPVDLSGQLDAEWDWKMAAALSSASAAAAPQQRPRGVFGPSTQIRTPKGIVPLSSIQVGDLVEDVGSNGWSSVIATIRDSSEDVKEEGPNEGCWIYGGAQWVHPVVASAGAAAAEGVHLLTESGTFVVCDGAAGGTLVRDFSEIGLVPLDTLRPWILNLLNTEITELAEPARRTQSAKPTGTANFPTPR